MKKSKIFVVVGAAAMLFGLVLTAGCLTPVKSSEDENAKKISGLETQVENLTEELDKVKGKRTDTQEKKEEPVKTDGFAAKIESVAQSEKSDAAPKSKLKAYDYYLDGETEATGYIVVQKEKLFDDSYDIGYFALINADKVLTDWIKKMFNNGNTINRVDKYPMLGLGCDKVSMFDGTWFKITGEDYTALKNSSEEKPVKVKLVFFDPPDTGGPCLSFAKSLTVIP